MRWRDKLSSLSFRSDIFRRTQYQPLFSEHELDQIRQQAMMATPGELDLSLEVHYKLLGEQLSPHANSGFEFSETRPYQPGDNIRFINWRRFANNGELYINQFHEERHPQCWLIMDRREPMRFGTRTQLKIRQAAQFALYYLFKAQQHRLEIGGAVLDRQSTWYETRQDSHSLLPFLKHINQPCPVNENQKLSKPGLLRNTLKTLAARLSPGSIIVLSSDFSDLTSNDLSIITRLATKHFLLAVHVIDPIEASLPENGIYQIVHPETGQLINLDCNDSYERNRIDTLLQQRLNEIRHLFTMPNVFYAQVSTEEHHPLESDNSDIALSGL